GAEPELAAVAARGGLRPDAAGLPRLSGRRRCGPPGAGRCRSAPAFASLDLLVITLITPETERVLPPAEMPGLRARMNDALLELVYDDPLDAWGDISVLELNRPLDARLDTVLAALNQGRRCPL